MHKLSKIENIGVKFSELLQKNGIHTQEQLLKSGARHCQRQLLAEKTGISSKLILKWVVHAELSQINGIGDEYAEILEQSGVDSTATLAKYTAEKLNQLLHQENERHKLIKTMPSANKIESWIIQAQGIRSTIEL